MSETINFKVELENNPQVLLEGYVNINDEEAEDVDWYFYDADNVAQSQMFVEHLGIDGFKGATFEQEAEINNFKNIYLENVGEISDIILQCEEDENLTIERYGLRIIINDGAKMECEIREVSEVECEMVDIPRNGFFVEVIPKFNGKKIDIATYMKETFDIFDPWLIDEESFIRDGKIFFEISKDYFEGDEEDRQSIMEDVNNEARRIYARALTKEMGIYSKYGEVMEQSMDNDYDDNWLFKMSEHKDDSEEELDAFLREEGLIDEELDY